MYLLCCSTCLVIYSDDSVLFRCHSQSFSFPLFEVVFCYRDFAQKTGFGHASGWFLRGSKPTSLGTKRVFVLLKACFIDFQRHKRVKERMHDLLRQVQT